MSIDIINIYKSLKCDFVIKESCILCSTHFFAIEIYRGKVKECLFCFWDAPQIFSYNAQRRTTSRLAAVSFLNLPPMYSTRFQKQT